MAQAVVSGLDAEIESEDLAFDVRLLDTVELSDAGSGVFHAVGDLLTLQEDESSEHEREHDDERSEKHARNDPEEQQSDDDRHHGSSESSSAHL